MEFLIRKLKYKWDEKCNFMICKNYFSSLYFTEPLGDSMPHLQVKQRLHVRASETREGSLQLQAFPPPSNLPLILREGTLLMVVW